MSGSDEPMSFPPNSILASAARYQADNDDLNHVVAPNGGNILAAIDAAMNNAIVARVEQWAKDNQIHLGKEQMQDLHHRLDDHAAAIGAEIAGLRDEMKQLQTKVQAQAMPRDLRSMIRYEIQRENSEIQRVLAQGVKKDLDSYNMRRADEIAGIRSEITGLRTSFNTDKRKIYQRIDNESKTTGKVKSGAAPDRDTLQKKIAKLEKELQQTREKYARALQDSREFAAGNKLLSDHLEWVHSGKPRAAVPGQAQQ